MKKHQVIFFVTFVIILSLSCLSLLNSTTVFDAQDVCPTCVWSTPNGDISEDGVPRAQPKWTDHQTVTFGGCDPASAICWEVVGNGRFLVVYDAVISPNPPDPNHEFVPVSS